MAMSRCSAGETLPMTTSMMTTTIGSAAVQHQQQSTRLVNGAMAYRSLSDTIVGIGYDV